MDEVVNLILHETGKGLGRAIEGIKGIDEIKGDTTDEILVSIEKKVELLRELVDFRMGKFD